jgi:hypothetical protein
VVYPVRIVGDRFQDADQWATSLIQIDGVISATLDRGNDGRMRVAVFLDRSRAEVDFLFPEDYRGIPVRVFENYVLRISPQTGRLTLGPAQGADDW